MSWGDIIDDINDPKPPRQCHCRACKNRRWDRFHAVIEYIAIGIVYFATILFLLSFPVK